MSTRQLRRLQQLVASSTGADGDGEDDALPPTMKPKSAKSKKSKKPREHPGGDETDDKVTAVAPHTSVTHTTGGASTARESGSPTVANVESREEGSRAPATRSAAERAAQRQARKAALRQRREAAEDALLEAALAAHGAAAAEERSVQEGGDDGRRAEWELLELMTRADESQLDMRTERIRNFGADAVEDVGDGVGPRYRPDGQVRDTGSSTLFPEHRRKISFRTCPLATPNRYRWPPYDNLGMALRVISPLPQELRSCVSDPTEQAPTVFALDISSAAFQRADDARERCVSTMAPVQQLVDCLAVYGAYHIPTLLQLQQTFAVMGHSAQGQELVDLALYQVGMLLSRFRWTGTWAQRLLPHGIDGNNLVLHVLDRGVHVALRRGCPRSAWELAKLLLSLDPEDPEAALLQLDYAALRAKRWVWLLRVRALARRCVTEAAAAGTGGGLDRSQQKRMSPSDDPPLPPLALPRHVDTLAGEVGRLPGYAFSAALARLLLAREAAREAEAAEEGKTRYVSKVLREIAPGERELLAAMPEAEALLATAIATFPVAAHLLMEKLQGVAAVCRGAAGVHACWTDVLGPRALRRLADVEEGVSDAVVADEVHLARLFVARHVDMWRAPLAVGFLRSVVGIHSSGGTGADGLAAGVQDGSLLRTAVAALDESPALTPLARALISGRYAAVTEEDVLGNPASVIPEDLLQGGDEGVHDQDWHEAPWLGGEGEWEERSSESSESDVGWGYEDDSGDSS